MVYMRRTADLELDDLFPHIAAIALDSPKTVGKTTTAAQRAMIAMSLGRRNACPLRRIQSCFYLFHVRYS